MSSIWCGWGDDANLCQPVDEPDARRVPFEVAHPSCFAFDATKSGACKGDLPGNGETDISRWGNFVGLYPPVYYATMRTFVTSDVTTSILTIRVVNAALSIVVVGAVALLVPRALRRTMILTFLFTSVPLGLFVIGSINPSVWAIVSAGTLWVALFAMFDAHGRRRIALGVAAVVTALMGSGARADSCLYSALAVIAVMVLRWGVLRQNRAPVLIGGGIIAVSALLFLTSGQANTVTQGLAATPAVGPEVSLVELTIRNILDLPTLLFGSFGSWGLGWLDTIMPPLVSYTSMLAAAVVVFWGWSSISRRKIVALAGVGACLIAFPLLVLAQNRHTVGMAVQPRYLLPILVILVGLSLLAVDGQRRPLNMMQRVMVGAALILAHSIALHTNLRRYITGAEQNGINLNAHKQWWWDVPIQPMTVWIVGSLAFAATVVLVLSMGDDTAEAVDERQVDDTQEVVADNTFMDAGQEPPVIATSTLTAQPESVTRSVPTIK